MSDIYIITKKDQKAMEIIGVFTKISLAKTATDIAQQRDIDNSHEYIVLKFPADALINQSIRAGRVVYDQSQIEVIKLGRKKSSTNAVETWYPTTDS